MNIRSILAFIGFCFTLAVGTQSHAQSQVDYSKSISLPSCSSESSSVKQIQSNSDWNSINDSNYSVFCVAPGNYSGAGTIVVTRSGSSDNKRFIVPANHGGQFVKPWKLPVGERVILDGLVFSGADHWVVSGLAITDPNYSTRKLSLVDVAVDSDNNIFDHLLIEEADVHLFRITQGSDFITLQNSVLRKTKIENAREHACITVFVEDSYGPLRAPHIVGNEIYDCAGDEIQTNSNTKQNPEYGINGLIIADNDMYSTPAMYVNCSTGKLSQTGQCACSENAIDMKIAVVGSLANAQDATLIRYNRMWGFRGTSNVSASQGGICELTQNLYSPAVDLHYAEADYVVVKQNIIADSENGFWASTGGPDHVSLIGNLFHDVSKFRKPYGALSLNSGDRVEAYYNAVVNSGVYLKTGSSGPVDLANNLFINAGIWKTASGTDFRSGQSRVFNNYYYATDPYDGSASSGSNIDRPNVSDSNGEEFCYMRRKLTSPQQVCVPNLMNSPNTPHVGADNEAATSLSGFGIDNSQITREDAWSSGGDTVAEIRPNSPTIIGVSSN